MPPASRLMEHLRVATAMAHSIEGVAVALATDAGEELIVAHHRPDAHLTPCLLRGLVAEAMRRPLSGLLRRVVAVDVVGGVEDLGAGVFRRRVRDVEQRWLATLLPHEHVTALLDACPLDLPEDAMSARLRVDTLLDTTLVALTVEHELYGWRLDEVALQAQGALVVAELTTASLGEPHR